jgi:hypothetical protein
MYRRDVENLGVKYGLFEDGPLPRIGPPIKAGDTGETEELQ